MKSTDNKKAHDLGGQGLIDVNIKEINMTPMSLQQITVPFHNAELFLVEHEGQPYTPMKTIVEGMGLDWKSQFVKLKQRFAQGMVEITIPTNSGLQTMLCLLLRKLPAWLYSIHANKVKPELRDTVIKYQEECDDVLWDYWTKGQAINQRKNISPAQQAELQAIVARRSDNCGKARMEMWSRHNNHFKIGKYSQLLAIHFEDAKFYLENMEIKAKVFDEKPMVLAVDLNNVQGLAIHMMWLYKWWKEFGGAIRVISPRMAGSVNDHFIDGMSFASYVLDKQIRKAIEDDARYYPWHLDFAERKALEYRNK